MKHGRKMVMKNGKTMPMDMDMTMKNGKKCSIAVECTMKEEKDDNEVRRLYGNEWENR